MSCLRIQAGNDADVQLISPDGNQTKMEQMQEMIRSLNYAPLSGKYRVFHSKAHSAVALPKYCLTVAISGALSYVLIRYIVAFTPIGVVPAKLCAETTLFFFSFVIQRDFVFAQKQASEG